VVDIVGLSDKICEVAAELVREVPFDSDQQRKDVVRRIADAMAQAAWEKMEDIGGLDTV
jgi:hypothetical protein